MPLPLTVSFFCKIQIGFTFLVLAHPGSPRKKAVKRVYVCMYNLFLLWYRDSVVDTAEENSNVFSLIQMHWLPSARACGQ